MSEKYEEISTREGAEKMKKHYYAVDKAPFCRFAFGDYKPVVYVFDSKATRDAWVCQAVCEAWPGQEGQKAAITDLEAWALEKEAATHCGRGEGGVPWWIAPDVIPGLVEMWY